MLETNNINVDILDNLIIGRVEPQIYAFTTETIPNYLKVGDTYRPIEMRLNEWRKHFPNLEKKFEDVAKVDDETFFRDYAVHFFLENELNKSRLMPNSRWRFSSLVIQSSSVPTLRKRLRRRKLMPTINPE